MRERYQTIIKQRIAEMQPGSVFVTSDFADIAPTAAINMSLSRLEDSGSIRRIIRGIYDKPRFSKLLNEPVASDPSKVAYAVMVMCIFHSAEHRIKKLRVILTRLG